MTEVASSKALPASAVPKVCPRDDEGRTTAEDYVNYYTRRQGSMAPMGLPSSSATAVESLLWP